MRFCNEKKVEVRRKGWAHTLPQPGRRYGKSEDKRICVSFGSEGGTYPRNAAKLAAAMMAEHKLVFAVMALKELRISTGEDIK